nr:PREDICTED: uncharacterized protein LOC109030816 [Bemisia tabaci]XP_018897528.1 PREDICTED: uncharacterized protein LOC109030816 [Bemisia tabaci]XP_018897529.1 PREDICTED: uncharacterized protein LOC109030816 [Bemisia tabaci]
MGNAISTISYRVTMAIASIAAMISQLPGPVQALVPAVVSELAVSINPVGRILLIADFVRRHVPWNRLWEFVQDIFSRTEDRISRYSHLVSRAIEGPGSNSR